MWPRCWRWSSAPEARSSAPVTTRPGWAHRLLPRPGRLLLGSRLEPRPATRSGRLHDPDPVTAGPAPRSASMNVLLVIDMQVGLFVEATPRHDAAGVVTRVNAL